MAEGHHGGAILIIEGDTYRTHDPILTGRQVRNLADRDPASAFRLIQVVDRYTRSVGLEEELEFAEGHTYEFRVFEGDRDFSFTVDERGFEWGASSIGEDDIRRYAHIADDRELVLDDSPDTLVAEGGLVSLDRPSVERLYSRKRQAADRLHLTVIVNGVPETIKARHDEVLLTVLEQALKMTENTGQPTDAWELRDEAGNLLAVSMTIGALGIRDGAVLLVSLKTGAAG